MERLKYVLSMLWKGLSMKRRDVLVSAAIIAVALGSTFVLARSKGHIAFSTPGAQLQLRYLVARTMTLTASAQPIEVPARTYTPRWLRITANKDGQTWQMTCQGPWDRISRIKVEPGETTPVKCGAPFRIVPETTIGPGQVNVDFLIVGQGGEWYSQVITKNGNRASAPRVEILDEQGGILASGQFAYG